MAVVQDVCGDCARRSWLVARLAAHLERHRRGARVVREVLALDDRTLITALGGRREDALLADWRSVRPDNLLADWAAAGASALCLHAPAYPPRLHDLGDRPAVLHIHGDPGRMHGLIGARSRVAAVVGARRASAEGRELARSLGRDLSAAGVTVASGMALGVDSAAHEGALAAGASTITVLACGPTSAYPPSRAALHAELAERALVLSELPPGVPPWRWSFPARNRIIAALAEITIVVEAAERSGSLITAEIALELGREVGAVPGSPVSWRATGANQLLRDGAVLVRDAEDVLDALFGVGRVRPAPGGPTLVPADLEADLRELLRMVEDAGGVAAAPIADAHAALAGLTELELLGLIERDGGRWVRRGR